MNAKKTLILQRLISFVPKTGVQIFGYCERWRDIDNRRIIDELIEQGYVADLRKNNGSHKYILSKKGAKFLSDNGLLEMEFTDSRRNDYAPE